MPTRAPSPIPALLLLSLAACGGGGGGPSTITPVGSTELRVTSTASGGGEGDALATAFVLSSGLPVVLAGRAAFQPASADLGAELWFRALAHLDANALATGAGASVLGSSRTRRLAALPDAPPDQNQDGTNLDETWHKELALLMQTAGSITKPANDLPLVFPWRAGVAEFASAGGGRTQPGTDRVVDLAQVAEAVLARTLAATKLLASNRGSRPGANERDGLRGLVLLQQAVAAEETLLGELFFDGTTLGRLNDPASYDPANGRRWLPASFLVVEETSYAGVPKAYLAVDRSSSLDAIAALLEVEAQLAWLGADLNPYPNLRDLLRGLPFGEKSGPQRPAVKTIQISSVEVTYDDHIKPLLGAYFCAGCHPPVFGAGGFDASTYDGILKGGNHQATHPAVVKGNAQASLLWRLLSADVPGVTTRMPQGGPYMRAGELALVADWINQGALKSASTPPPVAKIGVDLARVLLKNLRAMHFDAASGALVERHHGDAPARHAGTASLGRVLSALALHARALPQDQDARALLASASAFALAKLCAKEGNAFEGFDLAAGRAVGDAGLLAHARLTAGLFAAGRTLASAEITERARALGGFLLSGYWDADARLFRTDRVRVGRRYTPAVIAAVLEALREAVVDAQVANAQQVHDAFLARVMGKLVFSEPDGRGEVLGDGVADTDNNGIPEPALAGGNGRAPVFAGEILEGPSPEAEPRDEPITWSRDIAPLFRSACVLCHVGGAQEGGYRVDTPELAGKAGVSGGVYPLIVPGDPESSLLYRKLVDRTPVVGKQMPLTRPPLDARGKELVRRWILEGATGR